MTMSGMRISRLFFVVSLIFFAGACAAASIHKEDANVSITVDENGVTPKSLVVEPGTTLLWMNSGTIPMKVRFTGNAVSTTCKAPRGFTLGPKGIYRSEIIKGGQVASLCIIEPDVYEYRVELKPETSEHSDKENSSFSGKIEVKME